MGKSGEETRIGRGGEAKELEEEEEEEETTR